MAIIQAFIHLSPQSELLLRLEILIDLQHVTRRITLLCVINPYFPRTILPYAMGLDARLDYRISSHLQYYQGRAWLDYRF
jgi:hypothetical protein